MANKFIIELDFEEQDALIDAIFFYTAYCENKMVELNRIGSYGAAIKLEEKKNVLNEIACKIGFAEK